MNSTGAEPALRPTQRREITAIAVIVILLLGAVFWSPRLLSQHQIMVASPLPRVPAMWRDLVNTALAGPLSDFQRQALSDYQITDDEYAQAQELFGQCMAGFGWKVDWTDQNDNYQSSSLPGTTRNVAYQDTDDRQCSSTSLATVRELFWGMKSNPRGLTSEQQIRACFDRHDVPYDHTMTDDEFAGLVDDAAYTPPTDAGTVCLFDPTGSQGMTVADAYSYLESRKTGTPFSAPAQPSIPESRYTGHQSVTITPGPGRQQAELTIPASPMAGGGDMTTSVTVITDPTTTSTTLWNIAAAGVTPSNWRLGLATLLTPELGRATTFTFSSDQNGNTEAIRLTATADNTTGAWVLTPDFAWTW
jgi:hypothetical protein